MPSEVGIDEALGDEPRLIRIDASFSQQLGGEGGKRYRGNDRHRGFALDPLSLRERVR
jgi:hypothetical protein